MEPEEPEQQQPASNLPSMPGVPDGAWAVRRDSLEVARANILAIESHVGDATHGAPAASAAGGSGDGSPRWQRARRAVAQSRWHKVAARPDSNGGTEPSAAYWVNRVTEEARAGKPTEAEEAADVAERAQRIKRLRLTTSNLLPVDEDETIRQSAARGAAAPDGGGDAQGAAGEQGPTYPLLSLAGVVLAKKQAGVKKRQIERSQFIVKRGNLNRMTSAVPDADATAGDPIAPGSDSGYSESSLSALFVAGDGDISMEMQAGSHGQLEFESGREVVDTGAQSLLEAKQAKFIRLQTPNIESFPHLDREAQRSRVKILRELADFMRYSWGLTVPSVILSITGSATPFSLRPIYQQAFSRSLQTATKQTNAWVFTGGTDSGVMKLVGDGLAVQKRVETAIGVATWGAVHGRTDLDPAEDLLPRSVLEQCTIELRGLESLGHEHAREDSIRALYSEFGTVVAVTVGLDPADASRHNGSWEEAAGKGKVLCYVTYRTKEGAERACHRRVAAVGAGGRSAAAHLRAVAINKYEQLMDAGDKGIHGEHARKVLGSRGGVALPYLYRGRRMEGEGFTGSPLDRNHSHYLLVDDGSEDEFGRELAIRDELIKFFSFRDDMMTCSSKDLAETIRNRPAETKRSVPVVCLVYGGGVNSLQTILDHLSAHDPILVVRGSGRAADLIGDWKTLFEERRATIERGKEPWAENAKMRSKARAWLLDNTDLGSEAAGDASNVSPRMGGGAGGQRQEASGPGPGLERDEQRPGVWKIDTPKSWDEQPLDIATTPAGPVLRNYFEDQVPDDEPLQPEIDGFCARLDRIVIYPDLHFVDVSMTGDDIGTGRAALLDDKNAAILPTVLKAITKSSTILHKVKLPLAIRYNDAKMIKQILRDEGLCVKEGGQELSADARPLVFAAFSDQADVVGLLLDAGFDDQAIDHLILLELHQVAELRQLDALKRKKQEVVPCPPQWEEQRRHEISLSASFLERERWDNMSSEAKYAEQMAQVQRDWKQMAHDEQMEIARTATGKVTWEKLPLVPGWSFVVIARVGKSSRLTAQKSLDNVTTETDTGLSAGARYQLVSSQCQSGRGCIDVSLVGIEAPFDSYSGSIVTADEAKHALLSEHGGSGNLYLQEVLWDKYLWVIIDDPAVGRVLLRQVKVDEISGALTVDARGRWLVPLGPDMVSLYESACTTFGPWFSVEDIEPGVVWWRHLIATSDKCTHKVLHTGLSPLLRVFWAIMTRRDDMAELLYSRLCAGDKFVAAFLCSWTYRRMHTAIGEQQAKHWDMKAYQQLADLELDGRVQQCVFDEYVYFGKAEEEYALTATDGELSQFAMLSNHQKEENAKLRSALVLMGCDEESPKTRVDLAILSENKAYMAQRSTQAFLDDLWANPSTNGKWSDSLFSSTSPKWKWYSSMLGYLCFLLLYFFVYVSMPYREEKLWHDRIPPFRELFFWVWVLMHMNSEVRQANDDFDNFRDYRRGSGNLVDMTIIIIFVVALFCRLISLALARMHPDLEGWQLCNDTSVCGIYSCFEFLLGVNFIVCVQRLLLMLTRFQVIGVLYEIVGEILRRDVGPFLLILLMFILSFEVAAHFFAWGLGQRQWGERGGEYSSWFRGFGSYFGVLGLNLDEYGELFDARQGLPEWDQPDSLTLSVKMLFSVFFFILVVIILMNLLIAMMSDTFGRVMADAEAQWRTKFAGQVREFWDASLLPTPFNFVEHIANTCAASRMEAKVNHYSSALGSNAARSTLWGRHYVWPLPPAHFELRLPNLGGSSTGALKKQTHLSDPTTLRDLRHVSSRIAEKLDKCSEQIERNFRVEEEYSPGGGGGGGGPRTHVVVEIVDPNAIVVGDHVGARMAIELGVAAWWRPEQEHSRCAAGARGDVVGETVCTHAYREACTAACAVAVRLHEPGVGRVILVQKLGVRVVTAPGRTLSKPSLSPVQEETAAAAADVPSPPASGLPVRRRGTSAGGSRDKEEEEAEPSNVELARRMDSMQGDLQKILAALEAGPKQA